MNDQCPVIHLVAVGICLAITSAVIGVLTVMGLEWTLDWWRNRRA